MSTWNGNNFSIYKSEEMQVLKLLKQLGDQTNWTTETLKELVESALPDNMEKVLNQWFIDGRLNEFIDMDLNGLSDRVNGKVNKGELVINVKDFGAKGDYNGVSGTDDTLAFNLATRYAEIHTGNNSNLKSKIIVPAGQYYITGSIYLRKGQHLEGSGAGVSRLIVPITCNDDIIVMGEGLINNVATFDEGGLPPTLSNLGFEGGLGSAVKTSASGCFISDLMFTGSNKCITIGNGDVIVNNIIMDICPNGIVIQPNSQNILIDNVIAYQGNYDLSFYGQSNDIHISNFHSEYCMFASVLYSNGCNVTNITYDNCQFLLNGQNENFGSFIEDWSNISDYIMNNCSFRNMKGYAIVDRSGISHKAILNNCVFDGNKTNLLQYDQSTTSKGIYLQNSDFTLNNCKFRNLIGDVISFVGTEIAKLRWNGGEIENCTVETSISITNTNGSSKIYLDNINAGGKALFNAQNKVKVSTKNLRDWFKVVNNGTHVYTLIPYQGGKLFRISTSANTNPSGSPQYAKVRVDVIGVQIGYTDKLSTILEGSPLFNSSLNTAGQITLDYDFDSAGSGKTKEGAFESGLIAIYVPSSYYVNFDIQELI